MGQGEILRYLKRNGEATIDELTEKLDASRKSISRALNSMERYGEVDRNPREPNQKTIWRPKV